MNKTLYEKINRLRAFVLDSAVIPDDLAEDLDDVLDAAEKQADSEQNYFDEF